MTKPKTSKNPLQVHQMTLKDFDKAFPHEDACKTYLMVNRWPNGVICPRCGNDQVNELKTMPFKWECSLCAAGNSYRFSVLVGTIFENTNKPLKDWFKVLHMMVTSKKGVSALQVARVMGFGSYKTAHLMCSKIRVAMANAEFQQLVGYVEVDETFVGGKAKNMHKSKRRDDDIGPGGKGKAIVVGAVERKGNVVARVIANTEGETLHRFVREVVSHEVSLVSTDEARAYSGLGNYFPHGSVNHSRDEYVRGNIHTNTIEGFWSLIKRGIVGTFHKVSAKYLPIYVGEFEFRYNNRKNPDIFRAALRQAF
jgi:transposase-like protein